MSDALPRFHDRHVVVTGGGSGIGRATALRLASEGAALTLLARELGRLDETAAQARARGATAVHVAACDITDRARVDECFREAAEALGPVWALVANAGIGGPNAPGEADRFAELIQTNVLGTYACMRATQRNLMRGPEARHMVVIASILARVGAAAHTGYCASKAAQLGLVRAMAAELAPRNVQVNAVCPGWVNTEMARQGIAALARAESVSLREAEAQALRAVPLGRMCAPEDVAGVVAWLLSPDARGVTGQGIDINGGAFMG
jgi:NAD(P)-dependent dehydrogenase (short-subunit alcohol dehydrogenase family)